MIPFLCSIRQSSLARWIIYSSAFLKFRRHFLCKALLFYDVLIGDIREHSHIEFSIFTSFHLNADWIFPGPCRLQCRALFPCVVKMHRAFMQLFFSAPVPEHLPHWSPTPSAKLYNRKMALMNSHSTATRCLNAYSKHITFRHRCPFLDVHYSSPHSPLIGVWRYISKLAFIPHFSNSRHLHSLSFWYAHQSLERLSPSIHSPWIAHFFKFDIDKTVRLCYHQPKTIIQTTAGNRLFVANQLIRDTTNSMNCLAYSGWHTQLWSTRRYTDTGADRMNIARQVEQSAT